MSSIRQRLELASAENSRLLTTISETEYSVSAHQQANQYIDSLKQEIMAQEKKLAALNRHVDKEYSDHKKYRDSHMRRLAFKLGGKKEKFEADASREEREWLDAVASQLKTKQGLDHLNQNLAHATKTSSEFRAVLEEHNRAKAELDALYNSIFQGPTPEIPEEDERERALQQAEGSYNTVALFLSTEKQARDILVEAAKFLHRAFQDIQEAENHATMDVWGVGGTFTEMAEHSALSRCQQHVSQVEQLVSQAQRVQPAVRRIGDMNVAQMDFMSNVVFDNIFSDMHMRDRIRDSTRQLNNAQTGLQRELWASDARRDGVKRELDELKKVLDRRRDELQTVRREAFEKIATLPEYAEAPPSYEEDARNKELPKTPVYE